MRSLFVLFCFSLLLVGCQTTAPEIKVSETIKPIDEKSYQYNIGMGVGYSEVCAQFQGSGIDPKIAKTIKGEYVNDAEFARGYAEFNNFDGFDFVTGLNECGTIKKVLEKYYKAIIELKGAKT